MATATSARLQQSFFDLWGGVGEVTTDPDGMTGALAATHRVIDEVDRTCSLYRPDSDISIVNAHAGSWVKVDPLFVEILEQTLALAGTTGGYLDPTVGVRSVAGPVPTQIHEADYRQVRVRHDAVRVPASMSLDLNSTAKAWCADQAAAAAFTATGAGVLVGLCGDIATAGPAPSPGWCIECNDDHRTSDPGPASTICITDGGVATSSLTVRRTATGAHILNPLTMRPVTGPWRTVSVAAATCTQANAAATAALAMGAQAVPWLGSQDLPARLVRGDGHVHTTQGWPS